MDRESLDLNGLSRSFVKNCVIISHAGVDQSFSVYQHALVSYFSRNALVWKVNNKPFPHRLTLPLKFVAFDEKLCFGPQISPTEITNIAFLHIFNINVTSADDYRQNVRHNVSDWFAKLNQKSDVQWIIVVNTNRAKDRKTKQSIMEKIRTDFAKFTNRLFELPDTSDQNAFQTFVQGIQNLLFQHLTLVMDIWDKALKTQYEKKKQHSWDVFAYFQSMTEYGRLFWSFGAIEYSMTIFDDLEKLLHEFVIRCGDPESPKWLAQLLNLKLEDRPCLISNFSVQRIEKRAAHYLGMRNYLLCQQILMSIQLYQQKMKSNDAAPSLRSDCAVGIMQRAILTIEAVKEYNTLMNNKRDIPRTCCWTWWTVSEALQICQLLCDVSHLNVAPVILARLHLARFDALLLLAKSLKLNPEDVEILKNWLQMKPLTLETRILTAAVSSTEQLSLELEKAHDVCVGALAHADRKRFVMNVTSQLFGYLRSVNTKCPIQKLQITPTNLKTMPIQPSTAKMLKSLCSEILEDSESTTTTTDEMLILLFFISQCAFDEEINEKLKERLRRRAKEDGRTVDLSTISITEPLEDPLFSIKIENFDAVQTTDSILEIRAQIESKINFSLENAKIELHFSGEPKVSIAQETNLSVLTLQHEKKENICRLVSELRIKNSASKNSSESTTDLRILTTLGSLSPGKNEIKFKTDITKIGCYVLEKVTILTDFAHFSTANVMTRRPAALYCIATPHSVTVANDNQHFFAGVMQELEIDVEAKCDIPRETLLEIEPSTRNFQFLNDSNEWMDDLKMTLAPFESMEKRRIRVKIWLKIDSSICESAAVQRRTLLVKWMNRKYNICLQFVPVMVINSKTSMLTTDILLEVELNRAAGPNITTVIDSAHLSIEPIQGGEPQVAAPLSQFPVESDLLSIVNLIWKLPMKGSLVKHRLHLDYTVKGQDPQLKYTFDDIVELTVPDVQFEICTQVLSQQPGAQLCRATAPCHFVISIRFLKESSCSLLVVLDADERMWTLVERTKMVTVKDSGLGQLALTIIPVVAGFLPFPNVSIYECQLASDNIIPGKDILFFNRTAGKQIRVLSPNNSENNSFGKDESARGSNRIKKTIEKLFD